MVRAAIFDFGGVITTSPFDAFNRFEASRSLPRDVIRRINATNPDLNAWAQLERNEISHDAFDEIFAREAEALGHSIRGRDVLGVLRGEIRPAMVEVLRRCKERLKTGCITNNVVSDAPIFASFAEVYSLFDVIIESSKVKMRKPDPAIYRLMCENLSIAPNEAVYLDDLGINLKPARALGMITIKVENEHDAIAALEAVVGFCLR